MRFDIMDQSGHSSEAFDKASPAELGAAQARFNELVSEGRTAAVTLIERLRNPAWETDHWLQAKLNVLRVVADMQEAADELERAAAEIKFLRRILGSSRQHHADVAGVISIDDNNDWQYHHMPVADLEETWKRGTGE